MTDQTKYNGLWWLPKSPDRKLIGILTIDSDGKVELEASGEVTNPEPGSLADALQKDNDSNNLSVIYGQSYSGKLITLFDSFVTLFAPRWGPVSGKIMTNQVLVGAHVT